MIDNILDFYSQNEFFLVYVRLKEVSVEQYKRDFMKYIDSKTNIFYWNYKTLLISLTTQRLKCTKCSDKKEFYRCCYENCNVCICKNCAEASDININNYIIEISDANNYCDNLNKSEASSASDFEEPIHDKNNVEGPENNINDDISANNSEL